MTSETWPPGSSDETSAYKTPSSLFNASRSLASSSSDGQSRIVNFRIPESKLADIAMYGNQYDRTLSESIRDLLDLGLEAAKSGLVAQKPSKPGKKKKES